MMQAGFEPTNSGVEALLAGYVAGTLPQPLNVLVRSHLELSRDNRAYVRALETAAGLALEDEPAATLPAVSDREAKLRAIFAAPAGQIDLRPTEPEDDPVLPRALRQFLGRSRSEIAWKRVLPGIREYRLAESERGEAMLYWIKAGQRLPTHTHEGTEITLLLQGGFSDATGHFRRGDIAVADEDIDHRPRADEDEDCLCFAVTDAPLRLTGPFGRWVQPFLKR